MSVRIKFKARRMLERCASIASMFATDKEALIMRVSTILEMSCDDFDPRMFYLKHIDHIGSAYTGLSDNFTDKWAKDLVADALTHLK